MHRIVLYLTLRSLNAYFSADEMISETDRESMKDNHDFFTRMTNVQDMIQRLASRRVISDYVKQKLIRMENAAGIRKIC